MLPDVEGAHCQDIPFNLERCSSASFVSRKTEGGISYRELLDGDLGRPLDFRVCINGFVEQHSGDQIPSMTEGSGRDKCVISCRHFMTFFKLSQWKMIPPSVYFNPLDHFLRQRRIHHAQLAFSWV